MKRSVFRVSLIFDPSSPNAENNEAAKMSKFEDLFVSQNVVFKVLNVRQSGSDEHDTSKKFA